jgi:hypothetical protein
MNTQEIESSEVVKAIVSVYANVEKQLEIEHMRSKRQYLEKWGLKEIKTNKPITALQS